MSGNQGARAIDTNDMDVMRRVFRDMDRVVQMDRRTAIKGLLNAPCKEAYWKVGEWADKYVPVAFSLEQGLMVVLIPQSQPGEFEQLASDGKWSAQSKALLLSSLATELTQFFQTLIVPAQTSFEQHDVSVPDKDGCGFAMFKFALQDKPTRKDGCSLLAEGINEALAGGESLATFADFKQKAD